MKFFIVFLWWFKYLLYICTEQLRETKQILNKNDMKATGIYSELTNDQLLHQYNTMNAARFLMERTHGGSESTIEELEKVVKNLYAEIEYRECF